MVLLGAFLEILLDIVGEFFLWFGSNFLAFRYFCLGAENRKPATETEVPRWRRTLRSVER